MEAVCVYGHGHEAGKPCPQCNPEIKSCALHSYHWPVNGIPCPKCALGPSMADDTVQCGVHRIWRMAGQACPRCPIGAPEDPSAVRSERNHLLAVNEHLQKLVAATQQTADELAALNNDLVGKLDAKTPTAEVVTLRNEVALLQRRLAGLKMRVNSEEGDTNGLVSEARTAARDAQIELNWYRHELERVNPRLVEAHERNGAKPTPAAARRWARVPF